VFEGSFSCQTWKNEGSNGDPEYAEKKFKAIIQEEVFHMIHLIGYANAYPEAFGMDDFTSSIVGRETAQLECVKPGWWHPENQCPADSPRKPGNPANTPLGYGGCSEPNCDVAEFYKQALFVSIGMSQYDNNSMPEMWFSKYMPQTQDEMLKMLSPEFKNMIMSSKYHQVQKPITGNYDREPLETSGAQAGALALGVIFF